MRAPPALLLAAALLLPVVARAVELRSASHPGYGRIVLEFGAPPHYRLTREAGQIVLSLPTTDALVAPAAPRNIARLSGGAGRLVLVLAPGARLRDTRIGNRIVLDALDPPPPPRAAAPRVAKPVASPPSAPPPAPSLAPSPAPAPIAPSAPIARQADPPPDATAPPVDAPVALRAEAADDPAGPADLTVLLPMSAQTGAALLRRGDRSLLVFDERRPLDLSALAADPRFAGAQVRLLPEATLLSLPAEPGIALVREPAGWRLVADAAVAEPVLPVARDGGVLLPIARPGRVVTVPDPLSGGNLLVGTERGLPTGPAQAVRTERATPFYRLPTTALGVAVVPRSDRLVLRQVAEGFMLSANGLDLAPAVAEAELPALMRAATLTRRFDLPDRPAPALQRLLRERVAAAAAAPARARTPARLGAAETMISLGMGAEATALLRLVAADDGAASQRPDFQALSAIAALLADRLDDSAALDDPAQAGTDEITLWRALRLMALHPDDPAYAAVAGPMFAATLPLLQSYPPPLRVRLLPIAAETIALGGPRAQATALLAQNKDDPSLRFAGAILAEAADPPAALAIDDALAAGRDRLLRLRAARRAIELRLSGGSIDVVTAARRMQALLYAWRGDEREIDLRRRTAELLEQAGTPRAAMALLRETEGLLADQPDAAGELAALKARRASMLTRVVNAPDSVSPLEFVAAAEENQDVAPHGAAADGFAGKLAEQLVHAEMPARALPLLERLMRGADGAAKAEFGAELAAARLTQNDADGALAALADSDEPDAGDALRLRRARIGAQAHAALGQPAQAARGLATFDDPASLRERARLFAAAGQWSDAEAALVPLLAGLPAEGPLDDASTELLIELAADTASAHDAERLRLLASFTARLPPDRAGLFRLLTDPPLVSVGDLDRSGKDIRTAKQALATMGKK